MQLGRLKIVVLLCSLLLGVLLMGKIANVQAVRGTKRYGRCFSAAICDCWCRDQD